MMDAGNTRVPYRATVAGAAWEMVRPLPVCVLLENVRSLYNVGAFFRTADAVALEQPVPRRHNWPSTAADDYQDRSGRGRDRSVAAQSRSRARF